MAKKKKKKTDGRKFLTRRPKSMGRKWQCRFNNQCNNYSVYDDFFTFSPALSVSITSPKYQSEMTNPFFQYPFMTSSRQSKNAMDSYTNDTQVYYCPSVKFSVVGFLFIRPSRFGLLDRFGFQLKVVKLVIISFQKNKSLKVKICICIQLNYQLQVLKAKFLVLRKSCQFIVQYLLASNVRPRDLTYIDRVPYFSQLTRNLFSHLM